MGVEKQSFEYFSQKIIDCGEKVRITNLSEKYDLSLEECSSLLSKWVESQIDLNLQKEYIVSGLKSDDTALITIVSEAKLKQAENQLKNFQKTLFSVQNSTSSLDLNKLTQVKYKEKKLNSITPRLGNEVVHHTSPQKEFNKKKIKSVSAFLESSRPKTPEKNVDKDILNTNNSNSKDIKKSPKSKKAISPKKGKGAISSFFSARPTNSKSQPKVKSENGINGVNTSKSELATAKSEKHNDSSNNDEGKDSILSKDKLGLDTTLENNRNSADEGAKAAKKRPLSDDSSNESRNGKKFAKRAKSSAGRKRIIVDSSDEENLDTDRERDAVEEVQQNDFTNNATIEAITKVKVEEDLDAEVNHKNTTTDEKTPGSITYQDEDGFLITIKETKPLVKAEKPKPEKKPLMKLDKVAVKAATKQGSITSFFSKK